MFDLLCFFFFFFLSDKSLEEEYHDLENNIRYNHAAHLVLLGCFDIGYVKQIKFSNSLFPLNLLYSIFFFLDSPQDLHLVDNFIKSTGDRKIRTFGYGIFNTNYTTNANFWDDDDVDLLLAEFMRIFHGDDYSKRIYSPNEYITIFDAK